MSQIFISHSRRDADIVQWFSSIFGRTNVKAEFVEYESWMPPASIYIRNQINNSAAVFVLLGPNLANLKHTVSWIGSETGLAAGTGREIWVFEHRQKQCHIPIPYVSHYQLYDFTSEYEDYIRKVICSYDNLPEIQAALGGAIGGALLAAGLKHPGASAGGAVVGSVFAAAAARGEILRPVGEMLTCPYDDCRAVFYLHNKHQVGDFFFCPVCRKPIVFVEPSR